LEQTSCETEIKKKRKEKKGASERVGGSSGEKEAEKIKRERKR